MHLSRYENIKMPDVLFKNKNIFQKTGQHNFDYEGVR